jgi:hypothetical protein
MKCPKCKTEAVHVVLTSCEYDYCRTCKKEVFDAYIVETNEAVKALREVISNQFGKIMGIKYSKKSTPNCPVSCGGCSCHINPPCSHCTDGHDPIDGGP